MFYMNDFVFFMKHYYHIFMKRYYMIFSGIVQGVGFRYTIIQIAHSLNLTGYVRNLDNGNVEVQVQGKETEIDEFLKEVLKKKSFIQIFDYQIKKIPLVLDESCFKVEY